MNWVQKFFFGYCTLATLFLLMSGNLIFLLILSPVIGYFAYYIGISIIKKVPLPAGPNSKVANVIISVIFVILVTSSLYSIATSLSPSAPQPIQPPPSPTASVGAGTPSPSALLGAGKIQTDDGAMVNLREKPSVQSTIIFKIKNGEKFSILKYERDWTKVQLTASISGWVKSEFIQQ